MLLYPGVHGLMDVMKQEDTSVPKLQVVAGPPEHFRSTEGRPVHVTGVVTRDGVEVVMSYAS